MDPSDHSTSSRFDDEKLTATDHNSDLTSDKEKSQRGWFSLSWNRDSKNVFFWMVIVLGMIGVTAAIVLSFTISFLSDQEQSDFENGVSDNFCLLLSHFFGHMYHLFFPIAHLLM